MIIIIITTKELILHNMDITCHMITSIETATTLM